MLSELKTQTEYIPLCKTEGKKKKKTDSMDNKIMFFSLLFVIIWCNNISASVIAFLWVAYSFIDFCKFKLNSVSAESQ